MNIICDLDGTIIDFFPRYYAMLSDFFNSYDIPSLSDYRLKRRAGRAELDIVHEFCKDTDLIEAYQSFRETSIESLHYISKDILFSKQAVLKLSNMGNLLLLTFRKNRGNLISQLQMLEIDRYFQMIISPKKKGQTAIEFKHECLREISSPKFCIGDSAADINAARMAKTYSVGVLSGISDSRKMKELQPDLTIPDIGKLDIQSIRDTY